MDYDVLIVGGGMVGATLACALGGSPLRVAVLERGEPDHAWPRTEYDIRVSALTRASTRIFEAVGAWEGMEARRVSPYRAMHVWDATGSGTIHFDANELGEANLGHIVENSVILGALRERMAQLDNVELISPAEVVSLERESDAARLLLAGGRRLEAALVVGADGLHSRVREAAGITTTGWAYDQHALTASVRTSKPHEEACWQRFAPDGPLAFLPLPEPNLSSIVWTTSPEHARVLSEIEPSAFLDELQQAFGDRLGRMEAVGQRGVCPLALQHADAYCAERVVLVGNAAHAIHPLAGQGLNLGILDAAALAEVLIDAARSHGDIGARPVLRRYERWRKGDNVAVTAAMDGFKRLFGSQLAPVRWARNFGLRLTDATGPVKQTLIRRAMGLSGDLPRIARSVASR
ncbi:UbiH/UbiF/VisC/COQ6 family ubiquinone biosynthesis hydroxylase [Thiohalomonas denitrificans]|uniref:2-octaprenylphenol hydroxylase n=1 Tax=Thiohalomonas denitrificans TaxID=415747 RepID=A0A1G5R315_9GAMM|nr:UbiH/UbiF/VisC/COQ6 family ubiquinone biosynthesis hydroxylase [Thiohalomonas denitrificans]SCZ68336.1 2-octaprenylphenol hydroxylase [Thiohalomonas denitrificans]